MEKSTRYEDLFLWAAEPGLSTPSALSCNEPFSQISIAHHYVQRTGERATYNFSFRNNLKHWPSGNYEVSVSKDDDKSSGYCYARDTDLKCTVNESDPTILNCLAYIFRKDSTTQYGTSTGSVWCALELSLVAPGCGEIFSHEYSYEFQN